MVPNKWIFNRRLNWPRLSDCLSSVDKEFHTRGPASNGKTPVAVGGPCTSDGAGHRVRRTESTRTDVGDELTVICQVLLLPSCRKLEFRLSALMDSDLAWVNGESGRQSWRYADAFQRSIISEAMYHFFTILRRCQVGTFWCISCIMWWNLRQWININNFFILKPVRSPLTQDNVTATECRRWLMRIHIYVKEKSGYSEHKLWHFNSSVTQ